MPCSDAIGASTPNRRRESVSDKLWANNFIDNPVAPHIDSDVLDDNDSFISTGIREKGDGDDVSVNSRGIITIGKRDFELIVALSQ
jgi:hypothetical protein